MNTKEQTHIGSFTVDSGQAIVGDPCYLTDWETWNDNVEPFDNHKTKAGQYSYLGACGVTIEKGYGELGYKTAVAFSTGYGDGMYPVYAEFDENNRIAKIVIDFEGDID